MNRFSTGFVLVLASALCTSAATLEAQRRPTVAPRAAPPVARVASPQAKATRLVFARDRTWKREAIVPTVADERPTSSGQSGGCAPDMGRAAPLTKAERAARDFRNTRVTGPDLSRRVSHVRRSLAWHKSLEAAQKAARAQSKPIVWIQTLGTLEGYL